MRILFVHNALRSFVRIDRDILALEHEVDEMDSSLSSQPASLLGRLQRADLVYAWFASGHSFAPVMGASLLNKPSLVVVGGYDTAHLPEIGYGSMAHPLKRHVVRAICSQASGMIANSEAAAAEVRANVSVATPIHVCYHGFQAPTVSLSEDREPLVLTVGNISRESMQRKGHEVFVRAAAHIPEARFVLAGQCQDDAGELLRDMASPNVEITGYLDDAALNDLYARASVYVQASAHEGFGCALAEAMLFGCTPVVSRRGALPEVAGEYGLWVDERDPADVAEAVRRGLQARAAERTAIAARIRSSFPLERRRDHLLDIVAQHAGRRVA